MIFPELLHDTRARMRNPWIWLILLAFYVPAALSRVTPTLSPWSHGSLAFAYVFVAPLAGLGLFAWVAPWAWLWTGTPEDHPSPLRGGLQGLLLGLVLGTLLLLTEDGLQAAVVPGVGLSWSVLVRGIPQVAVGSAFVGFLIVALERATAARERAERLAREAQWILLKGQLSPHVFFNAMNNLTELIRKDPALAERAAMDLSDLFRRLMDHGQCHLAPLGEERALVERYLAIEALRLGNRLQVNWQWDPALDGAEVPPFLLQPLVENALKHGLSPKPEGGRLELEGRLVDGRIRLRVANDGRPLVDRGSGGSGLLNLEGRLRLAYGKDAALQLRSEGDWTVAEVDVPWSEEVA